MLYPVTKSNTSLGILPFQKDRYFSFWVRAQGNLLFLMLMNPPWMDLYEIKPLYFYKISWKHCWVHARGDVDESFSQDALSLRQKLRADKEALLLLTGGIQDTKIRFYGGESPTRKLARKNKNANNIFISQEIHIQESRIYSNFRCFFHLTKISNCSNCSGCTITPSWVMFRFYILKQDWLNLFGSVIVITPVTHLFSAIYRILEGLIFQPNIYNWTLDRSGGPNPSGVQLNRGFPLGESNFKGWI